MFFLKASQWPWGLFTGLQGALPFPTLSPVPAAWQLCPLAHVSLVSSLFQTQQTGQQTHRRCVQLPERNIVHRGADTGESSTPGCPEPGLVGGNVAFAGLVVLSRPLSF